MLFHGFHFSVHIKPIPGVPHLFLLFPQLHLVAPLLFFCVLSSINSSHRGLRGTLHRQKTFPLRSACEDGRCAFGNRIKKKIKNTRRASFRTLTPSLPCPLSGCLAGSLPLRGVEWQEEEAEAWLLLPAECTPPPFLTCSSSSSSSSSRSSSSWELPK